MRRRASSKDIEYIESLYGRAKFLQQGKLLTAGQAQQYAM